MSATAPDVGALPIRSLLVLEELGGVLMSIDSGELQIGRLGFAMAKKQDGTRDNPTTPPREAIRGEEPTYGEN